MHPVLRLWEDFLTDRGVLSLPALPRMLYVVRGAAMAGTRPVAQGEAWHGEDAVTVRASEAGATVWRWDLSTGTPGAWRNGPGVISRERLVARFDPRDHARTAPQGSEGESIPMSATVPAAVLGVTPRRAPRNHPPANRGAFFAPQRPPTGKSALHLTRCAPPE